MRRLDVLLVLVVLAIASVTLRPVSGPNQRALIPLTDYTGVSASSVLFNVVGNLLLFTPVGMLLGLRGWSLRRTTAVACSSSVAIELLQLAIPGRTTSIDDVITNTLGAICGYVLVTKLRR